MDLGSRIAELRKIKKWSQSQLAKTIEVSREIVGRYERNDAIPSIEVAKRIANTLDVSLDYLVGNAEQKMDKTTRNKIQEINKLNADDKKMVFTFLDAFITKTKLQSVL